MGVREGDGTSSFWFSVPSTFYYLTKPLVSVLPRQRAQARLLLTCASLRRPLPSETNLIPSWLWEEVEGGRGEGRGGVREAMRLQRGKKAKRGVQRRGRSEQAVAPPRRPAGGGTGTFSSSIPGTHPPCFCHFTTSHGHTRRAAEACAPSSGRLIGTHVCLFPLLSFPAALVEERKALPGAVFSRNDGFVFRFLGGGTLKSPWASSLAGPRRPEPIRR